MALTIRQFLAQHFTAPLVSGDVQPSTLSSKHFTNGMSDVIGYSWHGASTATLDNVLEDAGDDRTRIDQAQNYRFPNLLQLMASEGDVERVFFECVSGPVLTAFTSYPQVTQRNQIGPQGNTSFTGTVDCRFDYANSTVLIGELKKPGTITPDWSNPTATSTNKRRLGKELRG
ncbi:hypothetical protein EK21DRAFT_95415 [Setomelanomma holmii]|uniref:Uncharacterized protein n=1 Tax=Setomelanomma holmii TaxID=210430 RepID=A0A9P4GW63_9PLEO|nr:hypothetical protein EK21DRAFT_95415 [Setomelanomma holmii]